MLFKRLISIFQILGPGLLTASAAIGVSHLVQSTRAGTYFGYELLLLIILINIIKYPFIECGFRYTSATGKNLIEGYGKLSKKLLIIFALISFFSSFTSIAAVGYISAGIMKSMIDTNISSNLLSVIIIAICAIIIGIGRYKLLSQAMKYFMIILLISTVISVIIIFSNPINNQNIIYNDSAFNIKHIAFMLALMGWMPGPIELSVWHSLWLEARNKNNNQNFAFKQAKLDFNIGYFLTIFTAILFLILGASILRNSGQLISDNNTMFSKQLIQIYTQTIGSWSKNIIEVIISITILSTTLTLIDSYPRTLAISIRTIYHEARFSERLLRILMMIFSCILASLIIMMTTSFKTLIDFVTILAFLSAPLYAFMNYKLQFSDLLPKEYQPNKFLKILSWIGFAYFGFFSILFIYYKFFY